MEGGIGLVGELREKIVEEGSRSIADSTENAEGDGDEVEVGGKVFADVVVLGLLAGDSGRVRALASVLELRLDDRVGDGEVNSAFLMAGVAGEAARENNVSLPGRLVVGLGHGDGRLLVEGNLSLVEGGSSEVADGVVGVDDTTTLLAGTGMIAEGVELRLLGGVLLQAERAVGQLFTSSSPERA